MFPDQESARVYFEARRWPDGATCPACGEAKRTERKVKRQHKKAEKADG